MRGDIIEKLKAEFEAAVKEHEGIEFWLAREIQILLNYKEWRNFEKVVGKAMEACKNADQDISDHFVEVNKMVEIGIGKERKIKDFMLTRYACYLLAQNGNPQKEEVAFAQSYFALQTRKQELIEERIALNERLEARKKLKASETELSKNIFERGVDHAGFGRIRSKGDKALFGGLSTTQMKEKLGVPNNRPLADFLPTVNIAAKYLASELTNFNVKGNDLHGEKDITSEHVTNNKAVRNMLIERGVKPEELPAEEDIKKLERRVKSADKKILRSEEKERLKKKNDEENNV